MVPVMLLAELVVDLICHAAVSNDFSGSLYIFSESRLQSIQTPGSHPDLFVSYSTLISLCSLHLVLCGVGCRRAVPLALTGLLGVPVFQYPIKAQSAQVTGL